MMDDDGAVTCDASYGSTGTGTNSDAGYRRTLTFLYHTRYHTATACTVPGTDTCTITVWYCWYSTGGTSIYR